MSKVTSKPTDSAPGLLSKVQFAHFAVLSLVIRLALVIYAEYHDAHSVLKYTDVDYRVFSDAARFTLNPSRDNRARGPLGRHTSLGDPYTRATYRYTPLLALLLAPNEWIHPTFGKLVFSISDVLIGILLRLLLASSQGSGDTTGARDGLRRGLTREEILLAAIWMLNPLPANISTRGSAESLLGLMVIATLYFALRRKWTRCAVLLGLSIHWKIYPLIYMSSLVPFAGAETDPLQPLGLHYLLKWCTNQKRIQFVITTVVSFTSLSAVMYLIWGFPFLQHSYLYHVGRTDHRHNFSVYFYPLYLGLVRQDQHGSTVAQSKLLALAAFLPQAIISIGGGVYLACSLLRGQSRRTSPVSFRDGRLEPSVSHRRTDTNLVTPFGALEHLPFIFLLQTFTFVTLNKVCTSQYFMWYLWFLPLVIPRLLPGPRPGSGISAAKGVVMVALWVGGQALWLSQGYRLEFLGEEVFLELWASGLIMLSINAWLVGSLVQGYRWV